MLMKLNHAYFANASNIDSIKRANIALMSELNIADSVLKTVILQTMSNCREYTDNQRKNTFFFRLI